MGKGTVRLRNGNYFLRVYIGKKQREYALGTKRELPNWEAAEYEADNRRMRLGIRRGWTSRYGNVERVDGAVRGVLVPACGRWKAARFDGEGLSLAIRTIH